jgi:hypothetical protein
MARDFCLARGNRNIQTFLQKRVFSVERGQPCYNGSDIHGHVKACCPFHVKST